MVERCEEKKNQKQQQNKHLKGANKEFITRGRFEIRKSYFLDLVLGCHQSCHQSVLWIRPLY